jgi:hypothetical protein
METTTKTIASEEHLMDQLQNQDWEQYWLKLLARCYWILRKRYGVNWDDARLQEFSRSVISEIIEKVFIERKRNWNIERYPDFYDFIVSAIDSHINNIFNKKDPEKPIGDQDFILYGKWDPESNAVELLTTDELRKQLFDELQKAGAEDDELLIFECLAEGIEKPDEIRTELGLSKKEFHNAWRRFKRKREILQQILAAHGY